MIPRATAQIMYEYYTKQIVTLTEEKEKLLAGGVKKYEIDDRSLERFGLDEIEEQLEKAVLKQAEYAAILEGRPTRKAVGVVPRDF